MELGELAEQAADDRGAFENLYRSLYGSTYSYIRYRCNDQDLAEELTARVFMKLLERLDTYSHAKGPFKPWFYTLTRNVIADHFRRERTGDGFLRAAQEPDREGHPSPEEHLVSKESSRELLRALRSLSFRERDVLGMKFALDLTYEEISEMTGLTKSNIGVIVFRAMRQLREILGEPTSGRSEYRPDREGVEND